MTNKSRHSAPASEFQFPSRASVVAFVRTWRTNLVPTAATNASTRIKASFNIETALLENIPECVGVVFDFGLFRRLINIAWYSNRTSVSPNLCRTEPSSLAWLLLPTPSSPSLPDDRQHKETGQSDSSSSAAISTDTLCRINGTVKTTRRGPF
jgi:hypothetical protein